MHCGIEKKKEKDLHYYYDFLKYDLDFTFHVYNGNLFFITKAILS